VDVLVVVDVDPELFTDEAGLAFEEATPGALLDLHPGCSFLGGDGKRQELDDHVGRPFV